MNKNEIRLMHLTALLESLVRNSAFALPLNVSEKQYEEFRTFMVKEIETAKEKAEVFANENAEAFAKASRNAN